MTGSVRDVSRTDASIDDLTEHERHRLFAADRRRTTFEVLRGETDPVALEDLASAVAAREGDGTDDETVEHVAITLHHVHLPKMADVGAIDYDPQECLVAPSPASPVSSP